MTEALGSSEISVHRASYLRRHDSLTFSSVPLFPSFFVFSSILGAPWKQSTKEHFFKILTNGPSQHRYKRKQQKTSFFIYIYIIYFHSRTSSSALYIMHRTYKVSPISQKNSLVSRHTEQCHHNIQLTFVDRDSTTDTSWCTPLLGRSVKNEIDV